MKTQKVFLIILVAMASFLAEAKGQNRFGIEFNTGLSIPLTKLNNAEAGPGMGAEILLNYELTERLNLSAGWGWNQLPTENSFAGAKSDFEESGYIYGLEYIQPTSLDWLSVNIKVSGLYNHIEVEDNSGNIVGDTGHGLGYQVAGGIALNLGNGWLFKPGVKFNALTRDLSFDGTRLALKQNYVSARIGFLKRF